MKWPRLLTGRVCHCPTYQRSNEGGKLPTLEVLTRLADALELTVVELLIRVLPYDD